MAATSEPLALNDELLHEVGEGVQNILLS